MQSPNHPITESLTVLVLLLLTAVLYTWSLGRAPVYLGWDEARTAVQSYLLATSGRDMMGERTPLLFHITDPLIPNHTTPTWWQPMLFYLTAAVLRIAPLDQWSVRLPNVGLALLNVWLVYAIGRRRFAGRWLGLVGAVMLVLTPAHFFFARLAQDYFIPQTFVLLWLWSLLQFLHRRETWIAAAAGLALGVGLYTHISAWLAMPFFLVVGSGVMWLRRSSLRAQAALYAGFATGVLPLAVWIWNHPALLDDMFRNYRVVTSVNLAERVSIYWDYFNPSYLFFAGGADPMWSTRRAGVFLLAIAVLLPFGIWSGIRHTRSPERAVLIAGFLFAPVPIVLTLPQDPRYAVARDLLVIPFGVLLSVAGVEYLMRGRAWMWRAVAALLVVSLPIQFAVFARDYFTDYQRRSAFRHDLINVRGAVEYVIASDAASPVPAVYLSDELASVVQWQFHLIANNRSDLWPRTKYFSVERFTASEIPAGSLLVLAANHAKLQELIGSDRCTAVYTVNDLNDTPAAAILRKN